MKKLFLLLIICPFISFSQSFEGRIQYSNSFKSKNPQLKDDQLGVLFGTSQEYFIKGGDYKSIFNGTYIKMQLYRNKENKSYTLTGKSDSLYVDDYSKNLEPAIDVKMGKTE